METLLVALLATTGLLATPALAQPADPRPIRAFDVETVEVLGRAIYDMDQFAWHGTDALRLAVSEEQLAGMIGWIVVERDGGHVVRFGRGSPAAPEPFYDVVFRGDDAPVVVEATQPFSETELAMFRAVAMARAGVTQPCSDRYNSLILADPDGDGWLVWMMAATTRQNVVVTGGHYRFSVSPDGRTIEQADRLSRGCVTLDMQAGGDGQTAALMMTQVVSDVPVETFVFLALQHGLPFYVVTPNRQTWEIEGDDMRLFQ